MPVDVDALGSFLKEVHAWYESGEPRECQDQKRLRELEHFQERARVFDIECDGAPLSMAWFRAVQDVMRKAAQDFVETWFAWTNNGVPRERQNGCDSELHLDWECCRMHRKLKSEHDAFVKATSAFDIVTDGQLLSQTWFEDLAGTYRFDLPTENRPSSWIS